MRLRFPVMDRPLSKLALATVLAACLLAALAHPWLHAVLAAVKGGAAGDSGAANAATSVVPDPNLLGGEPESIVQVANLVYAGTMSSKCFADHFLVRAEDVSEISTSRRFHAVKLDSEELFGFPLVIMTGEGNFALTGAERENLRKFVEQGGLLLASAGCSSTDWDRSFRSEMAQIFPEFRLEPLEMSHPVFHMVHDIEQLEAKHGTPRPLEGVSIQGRLGVIYSQDGLNDTSHTTGCCCCGGNARPRIRDLAPKNEPDPDP